MSEANKKSYTRTEGEYENLERQLKEDRRDYLKDTRVLLKQLTEARKAFQSIKDIALMSIADHDTKRIYNIADEQLKEQGR